MSNLDMSPAMSLRLPPSHLLPDGIRDLVAANEQLQRRELDLQAELTSELTPPAIVRAEQDDQRAAAAAVGRGEPMPAATAPKLRRRAEAIDEELEAIKLARHNLWFEQLRVELVKHRDEGSYRAFKAFDTADEAYRAGIEHLSTLRDDYVMAARLVVWWAKIDGRDAPSFLDDPTQGSLNHNGVTVMPDDNPVRPGRLTHELDSLIAALYGPERPRPGTPSESKL